VCNYDATTRADIGPQNASSPLPGRSLPGPCSNLLAIDPCAKLFALEPQLLLHFEHRELTLLRHRANDSLQELQQLGDFEQCEHLVRYRTRLHPVVVATCQGLAEYADLREWTRGSDGGSESFGPMLNLSNKPPAMVALAADAEDTAPGYEVGQEPFQGNTKIVRVS
jgi:hypothetical protein